MATRFNPSTITDWLSRCKPILDDPDQWMPHPRDGFDGRFHLRRSDYPGHQFEETLRRAATLCASGGFVSRMIETALILRGDWGVGSMIRFIVLHAWMQSLNYEIRRPDAAKQRSMRRREDQLLRDDARKWANAKVHEHVPPGEPIVGRTFIGGGGGEFEVGIKQCKAP